MKLEWTEAAHAALRAIHDDIAQDQPFYAIRFVDRLTKAVEPLRDFPALGRRVPEAGGTDIREVIFQGCRIIYRLRPDRAQILTVVHGSGDLSTVAARPWDLG